VSVSVEDIYLLLCLDIYGRQKFSVKNIINLSVKSAVFLIAVFLVKCRCLVGFPCQLLQYRFLVAKFVNSTKEGSHCIAC
jgi:hypothetical protein